MDILTVKCKKTKQPLHRRSPGAESVVYIHLRGKLHAFDDNDGNILEREDKWLKRHQGSHTCSIREAFTLRSSQRKP